MIKLGEEYTKLIGNLQDNRTISGFSVALQWLYSGSTVGLERTKDERWINLS